LSAGRRDDGDLLLEVRVQPRAAANAIAGLHGERLKVRLQAPPVDGKANAALVEFLAATFDVPRARVVIEHGLTGRDKRLRLHGAPPVPEALRALLGCA
jgi:uncharacterized protein (TIGR00251 family)